MSNVIADPPVQNRPAFRQTVTSKAGKETIASAVWQALPGLTGAYQLLWCEVSAPHRRQGQGSRLLDELIRQAVDHGKVAGVPMRRMMALVGQKEVIARAWLIRNGFIHVHTLDDLARGQETLVMVRTFD